MAVQIITDSTFDMATRFRDRVSVVPLRISFCERDYIDGVTLTRIKKQNKTETGIRQGEEPFVCRRRQRDPLPFWLLPLFQLINFLLILYSGLLIIIDRIINRIYNDYKPFSETRGALAQVSGMSYSAIMEMNFGSREDFDSGSGRYFDGIFHDQFCF